MSTKAAASLPLIAVVLLSMTCAPAGPGPEVQEDHSEMQEIAAADQADRQSAMEDINWAEVSTRDAARRARVRELLESDRLRTGEDFAGAALVFQHGETASEILLAHVLAVTALAEGHADSRRMAALTLDRYLIRIGQPQVFGTNFSTADVSQPHWTLEPYDESLIPDTLRARNCVASRESTRQLLARVRAGDMSEPTAVCGEQPD